MRRLANKYCITRINLLVVLCAADIDECSSSNGGCAHNCTNLVGGHECSCRDGYTLGADNKTCADIDECADSLCGQTCVNLPGEFRCECQEGYDLDEDKLSCNGEAH